MNIDKLVRRPAREVIASFPGDVVVDLTSLHCATPYGIASPGERGYQPLYGKRTLAEWDDMLVRSGRASRRPTPAEREAAQIGSMFGWDCPGADPLNHASLNPSED